MGKPTGFLEIARRDTAYAPVEKRVKSYDEFLRPLGGDELGQQGARCMDCGIPYCHDGCPVNNIIPDWNDLVYRQEWRRALDVLHSTNNFPEVTGRICPAPCEAACTLNLIEQPVTIKAIECAIVDRGFAEGWITPRPAAVRTGRKVAVVGSGPSGLACAQQLARAGHDVTVYEKADRIGGLLRYGIPDFKLEKRHIDRRVAQMEAEGVRFLTNAHVGAAIPVDDLVKAHDAIVLAGGSESPRDLPAPGRAVEGVEFAMRFLTQQNRRVAGEEIPPGTGLSAEDKHVIVIGGGDTGSDCVGTSNRHGAKSVTQIEILDRPPDHEDKLVTWPNWPLKLRTSSSHEEGVERDWAVTTKEIIGENGRVRALRLARVVWERTEAGGLEMHEIPESEFILPADLILLAMGFVHPVHEGMIDSFGIALDGRGNVKADTETYQTSIPKVFAAGDMRRGQSLVVWAIREGRQCARAVDEFLMGASDLPR